MLPSAKTIDNTLYAARPHIETGLSAVDEQVNGYLGNHYYEGVTVPMDHFSDMIHVFMLIWLVGLSVMIIYSAVSYARLHRSVRAVLRLKENIFYCDAISSPFILGMIKPRIYLPFGMAKQDMKYVLAHEEAHIKRRDHLWKPLGFALLSIYWFHPLVWVAYILLCRDIELACDEHVIRGMGGGVKKAYAEALLSNSAQRRMIMVCPLAFGEVGVKDRVRSVLRYKKTAFWIIIVAAVICVVVSAGFLTDPLDVKLEQKYRIASDEVYYVEVQTKDQQYYTITLDETVEYAVKLLNDVS